MTTRSKWPGPKRRTPSLVSSIRAVLDLFVDDLLVAVEAEVVLLFGGILFGHTEALLRTGTFPLVPAPFPPAGERVRHALGVPVLHRQVVEHVDHPGEQRWVRDGEPGVLHVVGVGRPVPAEVAQEREHVLADDLVRLLRLHLPEPVPAQILVRPAAAVHALWE